MNDGIFSDTLIDCQISREGSINRENELLVEVHKAEKKIICSGI